MRMVVFGIELMRAAAFYGVFIPLLIKPQQLIRSNTRRALFIVTSVRTLQRHAFYVDHIETSLG